MLVVVVDVVSSRACVEVGKGYPETFALRKAWPGRSWCLYNCILELVSPTRQNFELGSISMVSILTVP